MTERESEPGWREVADHLGVPADDLRAGPGTDPGAPTLCVDLRLLQTEAPRDRSGLILVVDGLAGATGVAHAVAGALREQGESALCVLRGGDTADLEPPPPATLAEGQHEARVADALRCAADAADLGARLARLAEDLPWLALRGVERTVADLGPALRPWLTQARPWVLRDQIGPGSGAVLGPGTTSLRMALRCADHVCVPLAGPGAAALFGFCDRRARIHAELRPAAVVVGGHVDAALPPVERVVRMARRFDLPVVVRLAGVQGVAPEPWGARLTAAGASTVTEADRAGLAGALRDLRAEPLWTFRLPYARSAALAERLAAAWRAAERDGPVGGRQPSLRWDGAGPETGGALWLDFVGQPDLLVVEPRPESDCLRVAVADD